MSAASFQVGDRVRVTCSTHYIYAGMVGMVRRIVEPSRTIFVVEFDDPHGIELASVDCLELVESDNAASGVG